MHRNGFVESFFAVFFSLFIFVIPASLNATKSVVIKFTGFNLRRWLVLKMNLISLDDPIYGFMACLMGNVRKIALKKKTSKESAKVD